MSIYMKRITNTLFITWGLFITTGCIDLGDRAITLDAGAFNQSIAPIYMMPIIDGRNYKSGKLEDNDFIFMEEITGNLLEQHGFHPVFVYSRGTNEAISDQNFTNMSIAELSNLVPVESRVFLVTTINDGYHKNGNYFITCTVRIIDRERKTEIWKVAGPTVPVGAQFQLFMLQRAFAYLPKNKQ